MSNAITRDPGAPELPASGDLDHDRILGAVVRLAGVRPWTALSAGAICAEANVSPVAFQRYKNVEACFTAAAEDALGRLYGAVAERVDAAGAAWPDRACALVVGFLGFLVADRDRAWVAVVEPLAGRARAARKRTARQLVELAGDGPPDARGDGRAIVTTIEPQLAGLWELARQHLSGADGLPLEDVARSTSFRILSPYLSRDEALRHALTTTIEPVAPYVGATVVDGDSAR